MFFSNVSNVSPSLSQGGQLSLVLTFLGLLQMLPHQLPQIGRAPYQMMTGTLIGRTTTTYQSMTKVVMEEDFLVKHLLLWWIWYQSLMQKNWMLCCATCQCQIMQKLLDLHWTRQFRYVLYSMLCYITCYITRYITCHIKISHTFSHFCWCGLTYYITCCVWCYICISNDIYHMLNNTLHHTLYNMSYQDFPHIFTFLLTRAY